MLDDVRVGVDPTTLLRTLRAYDGDVISPGVRNSHHMRRLGQPCLYLTRMIEIFYVIFERRAWSCLHSLFRAFEPDAALTGWGLDMCFHAQCNGTRMLYDNRVHVTHGRRLAANGYTDIAVLQNFVARTQIAHARKRQTCMRSASPGRQEIRVPVRQRDHRARHDQRLDNRDKGTRRVLRGRERIWVGRE